MRTDVQPRNTSGCNDLLSDCKSVNQSSVKNSDIGLARAEAGQRRRSAIGPARALAADEEAEVVAGGGHERVDGIALAVTEIISAHADGLSCPRGGIITADGGHSDPSRPSWYYSEFSAG